ncbi:MAG: hypothetical protein ACKVQT_12670 [Burkholderiales bacterium]
MPDFAARQIVARGWDLIADTPEQLANAMRDETLLMAAMFKAAGIRPA